MSAYIVSKQHIDKIVDYVYNHHIDDCSEYKTKDELGQLLLEENIRSVNYRYNERNRLVKYQYEPPAIGLTCVEFLKFLRCLDYQACERPSYTRSQVHRILRNLAFRAVCNLPGYDDAPWGD